MHPPASASVPVIGYVAIALLAAVPLTAAGSARAADARTGPADTTAPVPPTPYPCEQGTINPGCADQRVAPPPQGGTNGSSAPSDAGSGASSKSPQPREPADQDRPPERVAPRPPRPDTK